MRFKQPIIVASCDVMIHQSRVPIHHFIDISVLKRVQNYCERLRKDILVASNDTHTNRPVST